MALRVPAIPFLIAALAATPVVAAPQETAPEAGAVSSDANATTPTLPSNPEYRLGPADKLRIITFGEGALSGTFAVAGSGTVAVPLIGEVPAAGRSISAFRADVEKRLGNGYLKNPRVSVEVLTYRPFYILGEVNKPGEYPFTNGLTVRNAVATANGFTYRANTKKVCIKRAETQEETCDELTEATGVAPGDTIRIKERFF